MWRYPITSRKIVENSLIEENPQQLKINFHEKNVNETRALWRKLFSLQKKIYKKKSVKRSFTANFLSQQFSWE